MSTVKLFKLVSGQEIIAKVVHQDEQMVVVESPLSIQPMRSGESTLSIGLMPFSWAGNPNMPVSINAQHILCFLEPEEGLKTQYLAGLAGLSVPSASTPKLTLVE